MNRKRTILHILLALLLPLVWSCGDDEPDVPGTEDPGQPEPSPGPDPGEEGGIRTLLVYMVADNSLGAAGYDVADLLEMREAMGNGAAGDGMRLLVYHNRRGTDKGSVPQLVEVTGAPDDVVLKEYLDDASVYSTDPSRMREVLDDVRSMAPAAEYGLILWSHSTGWMQEDAARIHGMSFSYGDDRRHRMSVPSLASVLSEYDHSFLYFDCCLMATVEVVYELRSCAPVIVASGAEVHGEGMPYDLTLPHFFADGDRADALGAARATYEYYNSRNGVDRWCAMSVIDTSRLDGLASATRSIMALGLGPAFADGWYQSYSPSIRYRIFDMEQYITTLEGLDESIVSQWRHALDESLLFHATTPRVNGSHDMDYYCGLGCNILRLPEDAALNGYSSLAWWRDVVAYNPLYQ